MLEILFQYGPVTLRTFNIFLALGILLGGIFLLRYVSRQKLDATFLADYGLPMVVAALILGRVFQVAEQWALYKSYPLSILFIWDLHFSFFGFILGLLLFLWYFSRKAKTDFWAWLDAFALTLLLALIFVNIGHFFNGTQYGIPTTLPWGVTFDTSTIPFINAIHPTQLYSALAAFLFFTYGAKTSRRTHLSGLAGSFSFMLYALAGLGIDFLHGNPSLYVKIGYGLIAALAFIAYVHCSHKKLNL